MNLLKNKIGLVMGIANEESIAWGIARSLYSHGAKLFLSYQDPILKKRIEPLSNHVNSINSFLCNVKDTKSIQQMFTKIKQKVGYIDFLVHSIAYSSKSELSRKTIESSRENFLETMDISCFSFLLVTKYASKIMNKNGSIITLSYHGSNKVIANYNIMGLAKAALETSVKYLASDLGEYGIRVNCLSPGPVRTLASSGIKNFKRILDFSRNNAPIGRNITIDDIGNAALYFVSDLSSSVTGEIHYIDGGYNTLGSPKSF